MRRCLRPRWTNLLHTRVNSFQKRGILTQSYSKGPTEPPLLEQTIGQHFASIVSLYGDRDAVVSRHQQARLTYHDLDVGSTALARGLANTGVRKGDRVAVSLGNNIEFATATYALFKLGAVLVPLNPAFNSQQVIAALSHLAASHLIIGTETRLPWKEPRSNLGLLECLVPDLKKSGSGNGDVQSEVVPSLRKVIVVDNSKGRIDVSDLRAVTSYRSVFEDGGDGERPLPDQGLRNDEVVNIQFITRPKTAE